MVFTVMAALAQMELKIKRERITDSVTKRRTTGGDLGGRRPTFTDSQIGTAAKLIQAGEPATQVVKDLGGVSRATLYRRIKETEIWRLLTSESRLTIDIVTFGSSLTGKILKDSRCCFLVDPDCSRSTY